MELPRSSTVCFSKGPPARHGGSGCFGAPFGRSRIFRPVLRRAGRRLWRASPVVATAVPYPFRCGYSSSDRPEGACAAPAAADRAMPLGMTMKSRPFARGCGFHRLPLSAAFCGDGHGTRVRHCLVCATTRSAVRIGSPGIGNAALRFRHGRPAVVPVSIVPRDREVK